MATRPSSRDLQPAPDGYPIKIVRDGTAAMINPTGVPGDLWYGPIPDPSDHFHALKLKLGEEAFEYAVDGGVNELADVIAVVDALAQLHIARGDADPFDLAATHPRGGFFEGVMMYGRHEEFDK